LGQIPIGIRHFIGWAAGVDTRSIDQNIGRTKRPGRLCCHIGQTRTIGQISRQNGGFAWRLLGPIGKSIRTAGNRNHPGALRGKQAGRPLPQTAGRSGDNRDLTLNAEQ
jgi:hypothetical protein